MHWLGGGSAGLTGNRPLWNCRDRKGHQEWVGIDPSMAKRHKPELYPVFTDGVIKSKLIINQQAGDAKC